MGLTAFKWFNRDNHYRKTPFLPHPQALTYSGVKCLKSTPSRFYVSLFYSRLDANHITTVPDVSFEGLQQLRHLWLDDNNLTEVPIDSLRHQANLQALTLALNHIFYIPDNAFANLTSLVVL